MSTPFQQLIKDGWRQLRENHLREWLLENERDFNSMKYADLTKLLLDTDLKDVVDTSQPIDALKSDESNVLLTPCILQIVRVRNVKMPKTKELSSGQAERLLRIHLTDGYNTYSALEIDTVKGLSLSTPMGTKVRAHGTVSIEHGFLLFDNTNCTILGGTVSALVERWTQERQTAQRMMLAGSHAHKSKTGKDGRRPPPWVPFGQQLKTILGGNEFRSLQALKPEGEVKEAENTAFESGRLEQIAAAQEASAGASQLFTGSAPKIAPGQIKSRQERVDKRDEVKVTAKAPDAKGKMSARDLERYLRNDPNAGDENPRGRGGRGRGRRGRARDDDDADMVRPATATTLADFLVGGLSKANISSSQNQHQPPAAPPPQPAVFPSQPHAMNRNRGYENRSMASSSDAANRGRRMGRPGQNTSSSNYRQQDTQGAYRDQNQSNHPPYRSSARQGTGVSSSNFDFPPLASVAQQTPTNVTSMIRSVNGFKVAEVCLSPWNDGNHYPATIECFSNDHETCTVKYVEYNERSTVPVGALLKM